MLWGKGDGDGKKWLGTGNEIRTRIGADRELERLVIDGKAVKIGNRRKENKKAVVEVICVVSWGRRAIVRSS